MNFIESKNIKRFFWGMVFLVSGALSAMETLDQQIKKLNEDLIANVKAIESVDGRLPEEAAPQHFLVDGLHSSFDIQVPKILTLINTLMQHKDEAGCKECLDGINTIFYLQAHRFINNLSNEKFATPDKSRGDKDRMLEVLFRTYCSQSIKGSVISYSYEEKPLALLVTEAMIGMFGAKNNTRWKLTQRQSCLFQTCFAGKVSLSLAINKSGEPKNMLVTTQDMEWFLDGLNDALQKELSPYQWKPSLEAGVKYLFIMMVTVGGMWFVFEVLDKVKGIVESIGENVVTSLLESEDVKEFLRRGFSFHPFGWGQHRTKEEKAKEEKEKQEAKERANLRTSQYKSGSKDDSGSSVMNLLGKLKFW